MPTTGTSLAGISSINVINETTNASRLVSQELLELKEVPLVDLLADFFAQLPTTATDASQFLQNNRGAGLQCGHDLLCNTMVDIPAEQLFASSNFGEVSFSRMSFGLQRTPQLLIPLADLLKFSSTEEPVIANDGQLLDTSVDTDILAIGFYIGSIFLKNDMQKCPAVFGLKQFGRLTFPRKILAEIVGDSLTRLLIVKIVNVLLVKLMVKLRSSYRTEH